MLPVKTLLHVNIASEIYFTCSPSSLSRLLHSGQIQGECSTDPPLSQLRVLQREIVFGDELKEVLANFYFKL